MCLGHGVCDQETRQCLCEAFWMQNLIQKYFGNGDSNCGMLNYSFYYILLPNTQNVPIYIISFELFNIIYFSV